MNYSGLEYAMIKVLSLVGLGILLVGLLLCAGLHWFG